MRCMLIPGLGFSRISLRQERKFKTRRPAAANTDAAGRQKAREAPLITPPQVLMGPSGMCRRAPRPGAGTLTRKSANPRSFFPAGFSMKHKETQPHTPTQNTNHTLRKTHTKPRLIQTLGGGRGRGQARRFGNPAAASSEDARVALRPVLRGCLWGEAGTPPPRAST